MATKEDLEALARDSRQSHKLREKLMSQTAADDSTTLHRARAALTSLTGSHTTHNACIRSECAAGAGSLQRATEHKDRLIQFDRSSAARTKVIDDQTDYFNADANKCTHTHSFITPLTHSRWLTPEERAAIRARDARIKQAKDESRHAMTVTLDFAGRQGTY